jgi:cyanate permease
LQLLLSFPLFSIRAFFWLCVFLIWSTSNTDSKCNESRRGGPNAHRTNRYIGIAQPFYSLALFTPTIIQKLGFTNANANLLSVPPYVLGFITTLAVGYLSDRTMRRGWFIIGAMIVTIVGYAIQLSDASIGAKYCEST